MLRLLFFHQENFTKEIAPDLSKTIVTMPNEAGPDGAAIANESADPNAFDS